ncbi:MAG: polymerase subunit sigma-24 [Devosia sp.]|nr:polymerase subunit sigma-24 [Devosia sp.]
MVVSPTTDTNRAIESVFRIEQSRLIAGLARMLRDVSLAEELAMDALVIALEHWPKSGIPKNPGAWLMAAAKRRAIDYFRRNKMAARKLEALGYERELEQGDMTPDPDKALDDDIGDERLSLIFTACHPVLAREGRVALTLRLMGGLTTEEIARAFLVPEPTVAQRIVRAKLTLADAHLEYEVPTGPERNARLASVLEVVYLIYNEGYSATAGSDWLRPQLTEEALRLGRILARLAPGEPEVHGLVALMEIQSSRNAARVKPDGTPILLLEQDRARWDQMLIRRGLVALERAETLTGGRRGSYTLQAAIAACHGRARKAGQTDWTEIAALYAELAALVPNPIVELNRAVAVSMAEGPAAGLAVLDDIESPALANYHLFPTVRGDLLEKLGQRQEARAEFLKAAGMTRNEREKALLLDRANAAAQ